jgi:hypothetical protein
MGYRKTAEERRERLVRHVVEMILSAKKENSVASQCIADRVRGPRVQIVREADAAYFGTDSTGYRYDVENVAAAVCLSASRHEFHLPPLAKRAETSLRVFDRETSQ